MEKTTGSKKNRILQTLVLPKKLMLPPSEGVKKLFFSNDAKLSHKAKNFKMKLSKSNLILSRQETKKMVWQLTRQKLSRQIKDL